MSLLGTNVFANPTTPLWGQGGGGGSNPTFQSVSFTPATSNVASSEISAGFNANVGSTLVVSDGNANVGPLVASALYTDQVFPRVIVQGNGIDYQQSGSGNSVFLATVSSGSNSWELSNISAINGVPYYNLPATQYSYSNQGGVDVSGAPLWGPLNTLTITPPINGKVFVQSHGTFVAQVTGGGCGMTIAVNGSNIAEDPSVVNAYAGNTNVFNTVFTSFPVTANVPYTIESVAQRSVIPPEPGTDLVVSSSRMFLSFSPQ